MQTNTTHNTLQEDEIDLRELFLTLKKRKKIIYLTTAIITTFALLIALLKTPLYEVTSTVQIGYIGEKLIVEPDTLVTSLNLIFDTEQKQIKPDEEFISRLSSIQKVKKLENFIEITTEAISNEEALALNQKVIEYIKDKYQLKVEESIIDNNNQIRLLESNITAIQELDTKDVRRDIERLKNNKIPQITYKITKLKEQSIVNLQRDINISKSQKIVKIDEQIKRLKEQSIVNLQRDIHLLKTQKIVKIDEQIKRLKEQSIVSLQRDIHLLKTQKITNVAEEIALYKNTTLPTIQNKINFHTKKLKEYQKSIDNIYKQNNNSENKTNLIVASMQMVNYQNLILNSQNKIEDLRIEADTIKNKTLKSLDRQKENIQNVSIKDLELQIENIYNVEIVALERQKENIQNVTIKDLELKIENINNVEIVELLRQKENLQNVTIKDLEDKIKNIQNIDIVKLEEEKDNLLNDTIRQLEYKMNVVLPDKVIELKSQIETMKFKNSLQYVQNSHLVGEIITQDYPTKPKKKLIVVVGFVTGFIFSIFFVFFLEFMQNMKKEEETEA